ncbi:adenine-specific DNA methyltransferase [Mycoplasmopsis citelli]|uniref:Adenine-specific DNA methyltransferase n=2 Tax=Mycoplasmopsis citelli TaxID=171281 RepID=A0A449B1B7_9BACT|nr:adenine-specific DNA methyltransferase [Mycoplasmopsis citelli]
MLSNHNTEFINQLYKNTIFMLYKAKRMINSKGTGRGFIEEVVITNY